MARVVHFEIPADNPDGVAVFYSEVFGWKIEKWEGPGDYWLVTTGEDTQPGINGAIMKKDDSHSNISNTIEVSSIDETMAKVTENGGTILVAKMPVPGVGYAAYIRDIEGNVFGLMQPDVSAA
jgi:predicted enzyme related to lactoylglutathione lyase